jgi:hypothetical protein
MTVLRAQRMPNFPFLQVVAGYLFPTPSKPAGALPSVLEGGTFDFAVFLVRLASTETIHPS